MTGNDLKSARERLGLTTWEVAELVGASVSSINLLERCGSEKLFPHDVEDQTLRLIFVLIRTANTTTTSISTGDEIKDLIKREHPVYALYCMLGAHYLHFDMDNNPRS